MNVDGSAVEVHDVLDDRQPQSESGITTIRSLIRLPDRFQITCWRRSASPQISGISRFQSTADGGRESDDVAAELSSPRHTSPRKFSSPEFPYSLKYQEKKYWPSKCRILGKEVQRCCY